MTVCRRLWTAALVAALVGFGYVRLGPLPPGLLDLQQAESMSIVDRHGELLFFALGRGWRCDVDGNSHWSDKDQHTDQYDNHCGESGNPLRSRQLANH